MTERIKKQFELVKKQADKADKFFNDDELLPEALQNILILMENCTNIIKDIFNNYPKKDHFETNLVMKDLYRRKILKQDYSKYHKELKDYRAKSYFGEYSKTEKILPPRASLMVYLKKGKEIFEETSKVFNEKVK